MTRMRIAVIGMGRSGTTIVTEMLGRSGVFLDEVNWAQEHETARLVDDTYLAQHFGACAGLPYGRLPDDEIRVTDDAVRTQAAAFVDLMDERAAGRPWAFKDPRVTILHDVWLEHMDAVIGVFRRPDEVAQSYLKQKWIGGWRKRRAALDYWSRFNASLLHILDQPGPPSSFLVEVSPDLPHQLETVLAELGLTLSPDAVAGFDPSRQTQADPAQLPRRQREQFTQLVARRTVPRS
jgi:hypothetical protein